MTKTGRKVRWLDWPEDVEWPPTAQWNTSDFYWAPDVDRRIAILGDMVLAHGEIVGLSSDRHMDADELFADLGRTYRVSPRVLYFDVSALLLHAMPPVYRFEDLDLFHRNDVLRRLRAHAREALGLGPPGRPTANADGDTAASCTVCDHPFGQAHRLIPGVWGGTYDPENVAFLCPNHHAAVHLLMRFRCRGNFYLDSEAAQVELYTADDRFMRFWAFEVEPFVCHHLAKQGRWRAGKRPRPIDVI